MTEQIPHFCILCGNNLEIRQQVGKERPVCPVCGWVYFADPKVAAAILLVQDGKVLLTRRLYEPQQGAWCLPAGFVDAFENPALAAERECLEETGLRVKTIELLDVVTGREHARGADIVIVYRARLIDGELKAGDDADDAFFFPLEELPPLAFEATRRALASLML